LDIQAIQSH